MNCPYCNESMGENVNTNFCPKCGHKLIRCATCGEILYKRIRFCPNDGTPIPEELINELPSGSVAAAAGAAAMRQRPQNQSVNQGSAQNRASGYSKDPNRSAHQTNSQYRPTGQAAGPYRSSNQSGPQGRPANRNTPHQRPGSPGPAPTAGSPVNAGPTGGPQKNGFKKGLLFGLLALLLVALGIGGYLAADKLMSGSSKTQSESEERDRDKEDNKDDKKKEKDDENESDEKDDETDESSPDKKSDSEKDSEEAISFNGDEKNDSKTKDSSDTRDKTSSEKETESSGIAYKPEKVDTSKIKASVALADSSLYSGMTKAKVSNASSSSVVQDNNPGIKNDASQMVDGNEITSWQEGAAGDGIGEWTQFILKKEYNVRYITFKMGNWRDQDRYYKNNRPKGILLRMGGQEYKLTFPDGMNEYMVEFSDSLPISDVYLEITSVYKGNSWDDTCISEMTIYAE